VTGLAHALAHWAGTYRPQPGDQALADRSLVDTVSVALAARSESVLSTAAVLDRAERFAVAAHILDFDDLHVPSTAHISTVCVPVALATGGGPRAYLTGAGAMARLGTVLGHAHYTRGWHTTATAGTLAAAVTAASAAGLDEEATVRALSLAVSSAGGVQAAFGTDGKAIQVGLAAGAGIRAVRLAQRGASAAPAAVDEWVRLSGGDPDRLELDGPTIPGGLAVKLYPCCYALQRPIGATIELVSGEAGAAVRQGAVLRAEEVERIVVRTPASSVKPLIHPRPTTGLEGKFSLEYAVAAAILDRYPGFASFADEAVQRREAQRLLRLVEVVTNPGGEGLLAGEVEIEVMTPRGTARARLANPPGAPANPAPAEALDAKFTACLAGTDVRVEDITWPSAAALLDELWTDEGAGQGAETRVVTHARARRVIAER
jgi:2-methylcitrate dehydratase PrpD